MYTSVYNFLNCCVVRSYNMSAKMASLEESPARTEEHSARLTIMVSNVVRENCVLT